MPRPVRPYRQSLRATISADLKTRVLGAFSDAMSRQWPDEITLDQVAADARTTRQTVIRLFGGKDGLFDAVIANWAAAIDAGWGEPEDASLPMIAAAVVDTYEAAGSILMRVLALAPRHPALLAAIATRRRSHRLWLEKVLPPLGISEKTERMICACLVATDPSTWALMRDAFAMSVDETKGVMAEMLCKALDAMPNEGRTTRRRDPQGNRAQLLDLT